MGILHRTPALSIGKAYRLRLSRFPECYRRTSTANRVPSMQPGLPVLAVHPREGRADGDDLSLGGR